MTHQFFLLSPYDIMGMYIDTA